MVYLIRVCKKYLECSDNSYSVLFVLRYSIIVCKNCLKWIFGLGFSIFTMRLNTIIKNLWVLEKVSIFKKTQGKT